VIEPARRLLKALESKGRCRVADLGMSKDEIDRAMRDLGTVVDDDNHQVKLLETWMHAGDVIVVELTHAGLHVARAI
jgi:hypothetical protein